MNPLDQLADIAMPETVSMWPLAWGYWLVIALAIAIFTWIIIWAAKAINHNKVKKQAIKRIENLDLNDPYFCHQVQVVLKQTCLHYFPMLNPNVHTSAMHSANWQQNLLSTYRGKNQQDLEEANAHIFASLYQAPERLTTAGSAKVSQRNQSTKNAVIDWLSTSIPKRRAPSSEASYV